MQGPRTGKTRHVTASTVEQRLLDLAHSSVHQQHRSRRGSWLRATGVLAQALAAVAQDLRCLRFGPEVVVDRLIWEFSINSDYNVTIGWQGARNIGGFSHFDAMPMEDAMPMDDAISMDTAFADAAVWVADIVQTKLAGYDFVQWPSRGRHLLVPRRRDGEPVWMDPHGDVTVGRIGELCKNATNYAAT